MLTAVLAWAVLGEDLSPVGWLGIAVICAGVGLMAHRTGAAGERAAVVLSVSNAVVIASYTLNDATGARASGDAVAYTLWIFPLTAPLLLAWLLRHRRLQRPSRTEYLRGLAGGACTVSAYALALWAMTIAPVAPIAALREASLLFGIALARIILGERPSRRRWGAAAAIAAGAAILRWGDNPGVCTAHEGDAALQRHREKGAEVVEVVLLRTVQGFGQGDDAQQRGVEPE